ncbi:MAG TPA: methionine aminotransferase [Steroidobacteraceae bacterium]|jgi:methionine aminotransferase|nr:methionine aminotransferase [Steroidobacteraceae bacterium]
MSYRGNASKLPDVGTTIFTVMSRRAIEQRAVNVGQGFPDYPIDPDLAACVTEAIAAGFNQYAPMEGNVRLRAAIAAKIAAGGGRAVDPESELTVSCGGTESIYSAIQAVVGAGDEAIVFDPAYDAYDPAVRLAGGRCIHIPLAAPHFRYDWERVRANIGARTRLIIINNPHNPATSVATADDLDRLAELTRDRPITVLADEVYEHVLYDGRVHQSVMNHPELRERSFAVYSFGKTLHITGWRVGYCVAPAELTRELRKVHQFNAFSIAAPLQEAIRLYLDRHPDAWRTVGAFFSAKRDLLRARLADSGLAMPPAQGSYFQLADYSAIADCNDVEFTERLINDAGVAVIPLTPFYREPPADMRIVRLCVAKRDETLAEAASRICAYSAARPRAREGA